MTYLFILVVCVFQIISTLAIFKLLGYTIVRYQTNERGGIHTGFASAAIVMVILGMCLHCSLGLMETLLFLCSEKYYDIVKESSALTISYNVAYLFSICWTNTICLVLLIQAVSMKEPKKNNSRKSFGFCNAQFYKWLTYPLIILMCYIFTTITFYLLQKSKVGESLESVVFKNDPNFYAEMTFYVFSGIGVIINTVSLSIFAMFMRKSYMRRQNNVSVWKKLPRPLKSSIKCCFIISFMWITRLISWIIDVDFERRDIQLGTKSLIPRLFQMVYSFQGLILFCVVFFYRSKQDQNPVLAAVTRSMVRTAEGQENLRVVDIYKDGEDVLKGDYEEILRE